MYVYILHQKKGRRLKKWKCDIFTAATWTRVDFLSPGSPGGIMAQRPNARMRPQISKYTELFKGIPKEFDTNPANPRICWCVQVFKLSFSCLRNWRKQKLDNLWMRMTKDVIFKLSIRWHPLDMVEEEECILGGGLDDWYDAAIKAGQGFKTEQEREAYIKSLGLF